MKALEDDDYFLTKVIETNGQKLQQKIVKLQKKLVDLRGKPQETIFDLERHALALSIYDKTVTIGKPHKDWREKLDDIVMHKIFGYFILVIILISFFYGVFETGTLVEKFLLTGFDYLNLFLQQYFEYNSFSYFLFKSFIWGISGGVAIVLPYLIPFLIGLIILEDIGYLPRVAFLMDAFMHRIGLHGTSIIPAVLGFGCNVPAVMATRILSSRRDKIIAAVLASMVPCSARSVVIFGLVAYYIGPLWAFMIYVFNIIVIAISGKILSILMPEISPGMVLEIPSYQFPSFNVIKKKTWFRIKEFITIAWPILLIGSLILGMLEYFKIDNFINISLSPLTYLLGLPMVVGTTLIFGVLRKELSLIMLTQALATTEVSSVMSTEQILTFTIFITFYIPCVATMAVLGRELNYRWMTLVILFTLTIAVVLAWIAHIFGKLTM
jgi:ferrous iron transport protein B